MWIKCWPSRWDAAVAVVDVNCSLICNESRLSEPKTTTTKWGSNAFCTLSEDERTNELSNRTYSSPQVTKCFEFVCGNQWSINPVVLCPVYHLCFTCHPVDGGRAPKDDRCTIGVWMLGKPIKILIYNSTFI